MNPQHSPEYLRGFVKLSLLGQNGAQAGQHIRVRWGQMRCLAPFGFSLFEFSGASEIESSLGVRFGFSVLVRKERRGLSGGQCAKGCEFCEQTTRPHGSVLE